MTNQSEKVCDHPFCADCGKHVCQSEQCASIPGQNLHRVDYCHGSCKPVEVEKWREELAERPYFHVKPNGDQCSSQLVDANDEPAEFPCDCGIEDFIRSLKKDWERAAEVKAWEEAKGLVINTRDNGDHCKNGCIGMKFCDLHQGKVFGLHAALKAIDRKLSELRK